MKYSRQYNRDGTKRPFRRHGYWEECDAKTLSYDLKTGMWKESDSIYVYETAKPEVANIRYIVHWDLIGRIIHLSRTFKNLDGAEWYVGKLRSLGRRPYVVTVTKFLPIVERIHDSR